MSIFWSRFLQDYNTVNTVETIPGIHKDSPAKLIHLMEKRISSSECTNGALPFHCTFYETKNHVDGKRVKFGTYSETKFNQSIRPEVAHGDLRF